eukprot:TRINITY_DN7034_c0_g2_i2.p1 TRINITY_DN7034_c0_g2~~TRINITY_DN7034_c0_g2_i2.p1  ORF type:complete len:212 (+),score=54.35 TRINITY_DN7034_c0_g2_i2:56-637(+)
MEVGDLLFSGAEARVFKAKFYGKDAVVKERFAKDYRLEVLDVQLRKKRMVGEAKSLAKCRKLGIRVPVVYYCDMAEMRIVMEYVPGRPVREHIEHSTPSDSAAKQALATKIGETLAKMHNGEIVHGDLTTSNMMVTPDGEICLIDFGLSQSNNLVEDFAVDLYVMERAVQVMMERKLYIKRMNKIKNLKEHAC